MQYIPDSLFIVIVLGMLLEIVLETRHSAPKTSALASQKYRLPILLTVLLLLWLGITGYLASTGFFAITSRPPRLLLFLIVPVGIILWLSLTKAADALLRVVRPERLLEAQGFRIAVEAVLLILFAQRRVASLMTVEGQNWDIVPGLLLPLVGLLVFRKKILSPRVAVYANLLGMASLANTAVHGLLSAPGAQQVFRTDPPFAIVQQFPFVWLPLFLVPLGFLLHALSLRQLIVIKKVFKPASRYAEDV